MNEVARWGIPAVAVVVLGLGLGAVRRLPTPRALLAAGMVVAWVGFWTGLALGGVLARFDAKPPPMMLMMLCSVLAGLVLGRSRLAMDATRATPLWALVMFQGFRFPLELVMHAAAQAGVMPNEMSFSGYNFDIVSGGLALLVGAALWRGAPRVLAVVFSVAGFLTLAAVLVIAVISSPLLHLFGGGAHLNVWIAFFPYQLLPTVLVVAALAGQVLVVRRLLQRT